MEKTNLKYLHYLNTIHNCPTNNFTEKECLIYRWTKKPVCSKDFKPLSIIKDPPERILDNSDKLCISYGLSVFDTLENATNKYNKQYNKYRAHLQEKFKKDKGEYIAEINIFTTDGVSDEPNESGHFTFHEYCDTNLENKKITYHKIFDDDKGIGN